MRSFCIYQYIEFRVSGGRTSSGFREGRIEVRMPGTRKWGVICGDNWDIRATMVACKHFGAGYGRTAQKVGKTI